MIASSPLSRWVSVPGVSEGGLMPPSGIHVAFPPLPYPPVYNILIRLFARAGFLCLILFKSIAHLFYRDYAERLSVRSTFQNGIIAGSLKKILIAHN